ncbi:MAG TPA: hypothetical protein VMY99_03090 [Nevskiaceae bacterium]|nr:hypothetical protein [Nevskiaceae bacterium]
MNIINRLKSFMYAVRAWLFQDKKHALIALVGLVLLVAGATYAIHGLQGSDTSKKGTTQQKQSDKKVRLSVTSEPTSAPIESDVSCGASSKNSQAAPFDCELPADQTLMLRAAADYQYNKTTYVFERWQGCDSTDGTTCYIKSNAKSAVQAIYKAQSPAQAIAPSKKTTPPASTALQCSSLTSDATYHYCTLTLNSPTTITLKKSITGKQPTANFQLISYSNVQCPNKADCVPESHTDSDGTSSPSSTDGWSFGFHDTETLAVKNKTVMTLLVKNYNDSFTCGIGCAYPTSQEHYRFGGFSVTNNTVTIKYEYMCNYKYAADPGPQPYTATGCTTD